ncbi:MAG: 50S ribosomal protein L23 [Candidatus Poseidoniaceae archaeon]|jgi:large subunit ribosomal protein L23|nr:50S ribosomal protein L23 [Candidatus Poseidoniaceae archaeon]MDP7203777.1 50S ribosomal protein L23 [Candidatus Poseidoniaceae archaeon]|tara:strand:+ start:342 stop:614 length:273 start_codon:yes stop_codon:yes gene_type:complete
MDPYKVIIAPWLTEKSLEARTNSEHDVRNRLEFLVHRSATKADIGKAVEQLFDVKVAKVNTRNEKTGKHASVKLAEGYDAEEAALKLGAL